MRNRRKSRRKRQNKMIMLGMVGLICLFSVGYATFSSEFLISGKGEIVGKPTTADLLRAKAVTTGEGLYLDPVEEDRYVYRGADPDNYIWLDLNGDSSKTDNETYRIMSVEPDNTIKVIAQNSLGNMAWDAKGNRVASGYCAETSCNAWGSKTTTLDSNGNNVTEILIEVGDTATATLPINESSLNVYLNTDFLSGIDTTFQIKIVSHTFNIGLLRDKSGQTLETDILQEKEYKWRGKIGLMNATDYVRASINSACTSVTQYNNNSECYNNSPTHNYLSRSAYDWTISPVSSPTYVTSSTSIWGVSSSGRQHGYGVYDDSHGVWPVFYLTSDISLSGEGTTGVPYEIIN